MTIDIDYQVSCDEAATWGKQAWMTAGHESKTVGERLAELRELNARYIMLHMNQIPANNRSRAVQTVINLLG